MKKTYLALALFALAFLVAFDASAMTLSTFLFGDDPAGLTLAAAPAALTLPQQIKAELDRINNDFQTPMREHAGRLANLEQIVASGVRDGNGFAGGHIQSLAAEAVEKFGEVSEFQDAANAVRNGMQTKMRARVGLESPIRAVITNVDVGQVGDGSVAGVTDRRAGVVTSPTPALRLLDVLPSRRVSANEVEFIQLTATGDAGEQMKEGDAKANVEFSGELVTAKIATVAGYTKASRQILSDQDALEAAVDRVLRYKVASKLENLLLNGDGVTSKIDGLLNQAPTLVPTIGTANAVDRVGEAIALLSAAGYAPNAIVMHPTAWLRIQIEKATDDEYLFGSPTAPIPRNLWNTPVVLAPAIDTDTALVFDTSFTTLLDRWQTSVMVATENEDDFIMNLVTILAELRAGLEVTDPLAMYKFDLGYVA